MRPVKTAVIGVGYMGRFHAEKLAARADAVLIGVADSDAARAKQVGAALSCRATGDYRELLKDIEAACIAVPTHLHREVAGACLEAGVHVLVEKPLAASLEEADALVALAAKKKLVLQVGHLQRYNPAFRALAAREARPLFIDIERLAPFKERGTDVDVVLDVMIHDLDLVLALARAPLERVSASGFRVLTEAIDIANARLEFADGSVASVSASRVSQAQVRKLRVFFDDLYVSADLQGQRLRHVRRGANGIEESEEAFERTDELAAQAGDFLRAARGEGAPQVAGGEGRAALELALRIGMLVRERQSRYA